MKTRVDRPSGATGEASPLLHARTDLAKQQTADRAVENFTVLAEGARARTPGTRFVAAYRNEARPARFVPFEAGAGDSYMLVFNDDVMRVYKNGGIVTSGGQPYEIAAPMTDAQLEALYFAQSQDVMFIANGSRPKRLTRISDVEWRYEDYDYTKGPVRIQNTDTARTLQASGETGSITVTASWDAFKPGHVRSIWRLDEKDFATIPAWKAVETPIAVGDKRRNKGRIYEVSALNAVTGDTGPNPPVHDEGEVFSSGGNVTWRYLADAAGYFRIDAVISPTQVQATVLGRLPAQVTTTPSFRWYEADWSDERGWPTAVSIVDQSLVWGANDQYWITQANDIYSFNLTDEDDAALAGRISAPDGKRVEITWILPTGVLVIGTRTIEWIVRGSQIYERLTATNSRAIAQGSKGSAAHQPVMVDGGAVFIGRSRKRLHFAKFDAVSERIEIINFTNYARHMLRSGAQQLAWANDPHDVLWVRLGNGQLAGVTFKQDEDVLGWHRRTFENGFCEQIACIQAADDSYTEVWLGMRRTINGVTRRYIEVMQPYFEAADPDEATAEGAWFLDCALGYDGPATTSVSGLNHLEGQTVAVFADGCQQASRTVVAGQVSIVRPASRILVGLPLRARLRSLPLEANTPKGISKGVNKSTSHVTLHMFESWGGALWARRGQLSDVHQAGEPGYGAPMPLTTGSKIITIDPGADIELEVELVCDDAFPFTLLGWTPEIDLKDS